MDFHVAIFLLIVLTGALPLRKDTEKNNQHSMFIDLEYANLDSGVLGTPESDTYFLSVCSQVAIKTNIFVYFRGLLPNLRRGRSVQFWDKSSGHLGNFDPDNQVRIMCTGTRNSPLICMTLQLTLSAVYKSNTLC
jgi:hypothetical protein